MALPNHKYQVQQRYFQDLHTRYIACQILQMDCHLFLDDFQRSRRLVKGPMARHFGGCKGIGGTVGRLQVHLQDAMPLSARPCKYEVILTPTTLAPVSAQTAVTWPRELDIDQVPAVIASPPPTDYPFKESTDSTRSRERLTQALSRA